MLPSDRMSVTVPLSPEHLDQEADRVLLAGLRTASAGVAICFVVFGIYNWLAMPAHARWPLVIFDVLLVIAGSMLHVASRRDRIPSTAAPLVMAFLSSAVVANILLSLALMGEPAAAFYVSLVVVITAGGMLKTQWAASLVTFLLVAWVLVAIVVRTPEELLHDGFVLFAGCTVAAISHFGRRREHVRLAELRARDARRKRELEAALADAAAARDDLDRKVEIRTSELRTELAERAKLEEQLRHAQKMEAVGRLAGGVAHDFNNLLTVIASGLELADAQLARDAEAIEATEAIRDARDATQRATELTRGLLALGRKQTLDRTATNVVDVIDGVERMIGRLAGAKVRVVRRVEPDAGQVVADRGQLEQVLLNLAINACDAMPDGGTLTISAKRELLGDPSGHLAPGAYVRLSIVDTGSGIDVATRASIFEPFFTTKPVGKGTGLGLAIAHGIVMQHGGAIEVESEVGRGSTFSVLLPRTEPTEKADAVASSLPPRASSPEQTILVVEDEAAVRRSIERTLAGLGYHVLIASDGAEALRIAGELGGIDLLLSDVIMPGMDGPEVASRLRARWPTLRVLFVSGYSDDRLERAGALGPRDRLLPKPYTAKGLATAVREVIAGIAA